MELLIVSKGVVVVLDSDKSDKLINWLNAFGVVVLCRNITNLKFYSYKTECKALPQQYLTKTNRPRAHYKYSGL